MLQMTMIDSINMPPRMLSTMTVTADPSPHCMQGKQYLSLMMPEHFGYQLQSCQAAHGSYLVQVVGGQYRRACDHIRECHPDAVKPDMPDSTNVAPATPESSPGMFPVRPAPAAPATAPVAQATANPTVAAPAAATTSTPSKSPPVVHTPQRPQMPSTGGTPKQTCTAPAAPHRSAHVKKPTSRLLEEI